MANHNLPTIASTYVNVLAEIDGRLDDIAMAFNTEHTASTNIPTNTNGLVLASSKARSIPIPPFSWTLIVRILIILDIQLV